MKIGLVDVDGHGYPNIALMKISTYYKKLGHIVELATIGHYDKLYLSKIFNFTPDFQPSFITTNEIIKGGSGYDITSKLPPEIDQCDPDYTIYPQYNFSLQFYSRGCVRNCPFCIVRQKEGYITTVKPMKLNPNGTHIKVLDNNFFANPEWRFAINDLKNTKQKIDLQGIDVRIITEEQAKELNTLKLYKNIHVAWDNPKDNLIDKFETLIKYIKPYKIMCYVLIGYWSTPEQDLYRVEELRKLGISPFVMPYNKLDPYQKRFARWVNHKAIFKTVAWENYR